MQRNLYHQSRDEAAESGGCKQRLMAAVECGGSKRRLMAAVQSGGRNMEGKTSTPRTPQPLEQQHPEGDKKQEQREDPFQQSYLGLVGDIRAHSCHRD